MFQKILHYTKKYILYTFIIIGLLNLYNTSLYAQSNTKGDAIEYPPEGYFDIKDVDVLPVFSQSKTYQKNNIQFLLKDLHNFFDKNFNKAIEPRVQIGDTISISIMIGITETGTIGHAEAYPKKNSFLLSDETIRIATMLPKMIPAKKNNRNVRVKFWFNYKFEVEELLTKNAIDFRKIDSPPRLKGYKETQNTNFIHQSFFDNLHDYVSKNIDIETIKIEYGGGRFKTFIKFTINNNNEIEEIEVNTSNILLRKEILRSLKELPILTPAIKNKKPVNVRYAFPLIITIYS